MSNNLKALACDGDPNRGAYFEINFSDFVFSEIHTFQAAEEAYREAKNAADSSPFQIFIINWQLKGTNGYVLIQKLRQIPTYRFTPIVIYANEFSEKDQILAEEFNVDNKLVGPLKANLLKERISEVLEGSHQDSPDRVKLLEKALVAQKYDQVFSLTAELVTAGKYPDAALKLKGDAYTLQKEHKKALEAYKEAFATNKKNNLVLDALGLFSLRVRQYKTAIKYFTVAHKRVGKNIVRINYLGKCYMHNSEYEKSKEMYKLLQHLDQESDDAAEGLGKIAFHLDQFELAEKYFAETTTPARLCSYFNQMGNKLVAEEKIKEGIEIYKKALDIVPANDKTYMLLYNTGLAYRKGDNLAKALELFCLALQSSPEDEKVRKTVQSVYNTCQNSDIAVNEELVQAVLTVPNSSKKAG